ncbi:MAG: nucleotidyl transferase AbiEii/AbiGii toxin family protein [Candidatus Marinimicrobia bacterium]|nr:nucleotidyl transferase AbiEii/AbiGii toxin family protein [Candidatus Neomarinimicrobiota bacterium]
MIKPREIQQKARRIGVRDQQIEKDYVLSWILKGISEHDFLSNKLIFKGGTVLKKIYFEDYRFSEDLDFTILDHHMTNDQLFQWFTETFDYIREEANIPLEIIDENEFRTGGINFYISYIGPLGGQGNNKKVKIDVSRNETLVFDPTNKNTFICYSDLDTYKLQCYSLEEILIEKMRSVMQRMQARDFYDIWYLLAIHKMDAEYLIPEFKTKCAAQELNATDFHKQMHKRLPQYKARWQGSLKEQIKNIPDFNQAEREILRSIRQLKF